MTPERRQQHATVVALRRRIEGRGAERGFTLVEMMIAMLAGLMVSAAAFLLARNATSFFQAEAGITTAQLGTVVGLTRLQTDLRRAAFQSSTNVQTDNKLCGNQAGWPNGMREISAAYIEQGGSVVRHGGDHALTTANGLNPDALIISGTVGTTEHFAIQAMYNGPGGGYDVMLQRDGAYWRTRLAAADPTTMLDEVFVPGRYARIIDSQGREVYGLITSLNMAGNNPVVSLSAVPSVPTMDTTGVCGCKLPCIGGLINPVARVLYDLRAVDAAVYPQYTGLYAKATHLEAAKHKGLAPLARTELVRVELDSDDNELPTTLEVLTEYAVDLKFGITVAVPGGPPDFLPTITRFPIGDPQVYIVAALLAANGTPQRIRKVQVRLSARAPRRDRDVGLMKTPPSGGLFRFSLGPNRGFARMRTLIADVALPNTNGANW